ncbi:MAG: dihydropteroate synthase [Ferruginibacter sp.]
MHTLNCKGKILALEKPVVMGILNITPDSFHTGYLSQRPEAILAVAAKMLEDGAAIIDIGGQSTRPGSRYLTAAEENERVLPVIEYLQQHLPEAIFSIDTFHSEVAKAAVDAGASIVNDISSGDMDPQMIAVVAQLKVPYVCMHMQGTPASMQQDPQYADVTREVLDYFIQKTDTCRQAGIHDVIIDPGFGFGKTTEHNYTLLKNLAVFNMLERPVLAGLSRKSMINKVIGTEAAEALNGTTVLNTLALQNGAHILRVHDVKEACEAIALTEMYKRS